MSYVDRHPEDVKAAIRKRFASLNNFERAHGLPRHSVSDLLRGKKSARVAAAVDKLLIDRTSMATPSSVSDMSDVSARSRRAHRLNAKAA